MVSTLVRNPFGMTLEIMCPSNIQTEPNNKSGFRNCILRLAESENCVFL